MRAIHADPKEIRKIFAEKYLVPDFQRPYSWEIDQCNKLLEDVFLFFEEKPSKEDKYFLGNMVIHPEGDSFVVIDGQQRLTTILLLIKVLHSKAGTVKALEECLKIKDPLTSELTNELRVNSFVIEKDKEYLYDIIFNSGNKTPETSGMKINFRHINLKIDEWWLKERNSTSKLNEFILILLDQIVLLPIHCGSEDDALVIFETINNRGMSLTDADIFKAKLHRSAGSEKDDFINQWKKIDNHEWYFRIYMHIIRAQEGDQGKEIALRSYFSTKDRLSNWKSVMNSIKLFCNIECSWAPTNDINILWHILYTYPNYYWNYPLYVYLHKHGNLVDDEFILPENRIDEFTELLKATLKYFFIKGVVHNAVNSVKDTVFKVCVLIEKEGNYLEEYKKNIGSDNEEFERRINNHQYGRYLKGLVLLSSYLNPEQNKVEYEKFMLSNFHIEHILPVKWNNYDEWTDLTWQQNLNTLGNLIPLEWKLNITAKNEFFNRKKDSYKNSSVQDAIDLIDQPEWYPSHWEVNHALKLKRVLDFFKE